MQGIVEACGGTLFNQARVMHGVEVPCLIEQPVDPLFNGLPSPFTIGLYHSWAADPTTLPAELRITARSDQGVIMALRHTRYNVCGVQFHPESVMTPLGGKIMENWVKEG
jgi:anthranilate synthase component 2